MSSGDPTVLSRTVETLLQQMGVTQYEPRVVAMLCAFLAVHTKDIINTAEDYSVHAGRDSRDIQASDIHLALNAKGPALNAGFDPVLPTGLPSKPSTNLLGQIAARVNAVP